MSFDPPPQLFLSLAGPLRLWSAGGAEIPITSEMVRRLLAILLLSKDMRRSRAALQLILWGPSHSDPAANLRQLLRQARVRLGPHAHHLVAEGSTVALAGVENRTERTEGQQVEFFEDAGIGSEDFEDWYRIERQAFEALPVKPETPERLTFWRPRPSVGLVTEGLTLDTGQGAIVASWVGNRIRDVFVTNAFVAFSDQRGTASAAPSDALVRVSAQDIGSSVEVSIAGDFAGVCRWSQTQVLSAHGDLITQRDTVLEFAHKAASAIEGIVMGLSTPNEGFGHDLFGAVKDLNTLQPDRVRAADSTLKRLYQARPEPRAAAWWAYAQMVLCDLRLHPDDEKQALIRVDDVMREALDGNAADIGVLSVSALVEGLLRRRPGAAWGLSDEALERAPFSPFAQHVRAVLELHHGAFDIARRHAEIAHRLGRFGPMRHTLAGMDVVLACVSAEHAQAVQLGRTLLHIRPQMPAVIWHLAASLLETGAAAEADQLLATLPEIDLRDGLDLQPGAFPLLSPSSLQHLAHIFAKHGVPVGPREVPANVLRMT